MGDRPPWKQRIERLQDHIHQFLAGLHVARTGRRRLGAQDASLGEPEGNQSARAVAVAQRRIETSPIRQYQTHPSTMAMRRLAGPPGLRVASGEVEFDLPARDRDPNPYANRLALVDAVVIEEPFRLADAVGDCRQRGAELLGRGLDHRVHRGDNRIGAVALAHRVHVLAPDPRHADLPRDIAQHDIGRARVRRDQPHHVLVGLARIVDADRRQQHPLVIELGRLAVGRTRHRPAYVRLVRDRGGERDQPAVMDDGRGEAHVGGVRHVPLIGVVGDEHVAFAQVLRPVEGEDPLHQVEIDRPVEKHPRAPRPAGPRHPRLCS